MTLDDIGRSLAGIRGAARWLAIFSTLVFFFQHIWGAWMLREFGLSPALVLQDHRYWQLVTYQFLHASILHWLFNMIVLWSIGDLLESQWGTAFFLRFMMVTGVGAAFVILLLAPHDAKPVIGLSASLFGMLVAFAMLYPHRIIHVYFVIPVKAWVLAALLGLVTFFTTLEGGGSALTGMAHLSGLIFGYLYIRFGAPVDRQFSRAFDGFKGLLVTPHAKKRSALHEVTDDLVSEVDRILDKVSREGAESLTPKEKEIMSRYTRLRQ